MSAYGCSHAEVSRLDGDVLALNLSPFPLTARLRARRLIAPLLFLPHLSCTLRSLVAWQGVLSPGRWLLYAHSSIPLHHVIPCWVPLA